jgi:hypothetical protein
MPGDLKEEAQRIEFSRAFFVGLMNQGLVYAKIGKLSIG